MKKIIFILTVFLFTYSSFVFSENRRIDKLTFDSLANYVNCRYAKVYIEYLIDSTENISDIDKKSYTDTIKTKLIVKSYKGALVGVQLDTLLRNHNWGSTAKICSNWYKSKNFNQVISKSNIEIIQYLLSREGIYSGVIINDSANIESELIKIFPDVNNNNGKNQNPPDNGKKYNWIWICSILLLVQFLISYLLFRYISKKNNKLESEINHRINKHSGNILDLLNRVRSLEDQPLKNNLNDLFTGEYKNQIINVLVPEIKKQIDEEKRGGESKTETGTKTEINRLNEKDTVKYLKTIQDGIFYSVSNIPSDCFFKLFNENGRTANFEFCGDEQIAIANKDSIKEVCETSGSSIEARGIQNIKDGAGIVELQENGTWKVTQKAKVKFIS
ncbi:hypothetical protein Palpr_2045 [Paludibacter propionicigenes WB4]|uniref:Uncharacterized protein n=1 Tax=Paludibacter propionicigenes (strain DSM 17365 / JCM 13257 / WB4) TaxID=694427 RepID=E4T638_PALPW|nr:hypothetical protein [Paludibacter propionicigenes]ADQ80182.1 hypothetical protein Palpr_2045 [Paludibacter propionicigenes WB4]